MLVEKYPYKKISRESVDGERFYTCPDGTKVASVTSILGATKSEESKQALHNWRNRVGHRKATEITTSAANRGTRMHSYLEKYIVNDSLGDCGTNPYAQESWKMANEIVNTVLHKVTEFYGSEVGLYYPHIYAGTTDCIGLYEGELTIIDFKQSNKPKNEAWIDDYKCQLIAYMQSHDKLYGTNIKRGINMICTPDLTYQQFEINSDNYNKYEDMWWKRLEQYYGSVR